MATQSVRIGWRPYVNVVTQVVNAVDADATAFISAAGITNLTQAAAINTLVNDLKTYGLWTKMKAIYPFVGGSATSHKFNLKDPRDLDAAYRLVFNGGWIHSSTGAKPNGTTGYADTKLIPSVNYPTISDISVGFYSRTNIAQASSDIATYQNSSQCIGFQTRWTDNNIYSQLYRDASPYNIVVSNTDSSGLFTLSRTSTGSLKQFRNATILGTSTASIAGSIPTIAICLSNNGSNGSYSSREQAFAFIGNGLSDTEASNFYNSVQKFQTTLGRQIGSPIVSDSDAQAFLNTTGITDLGQATAINTLVTDLKTAGVWTKMKAIYPFVGGTATSHKFNLKDPRDLDAAYRLVFSGGWTHTGAGALSNGTTGYANTNINANQIFTSTDGLMGIYTPSTSLSGGSYIYGVSNMSDSEWSMYSASGSIGFGMYRSNTVSSTTTLPGLSAIGMETNGHRSVYKNNSRLTSTPAGFIPMPQNLKMYLSARNANGNVDGFTGGLYSFSFISSTLTLTEYSAFYTAVQKYQTSLGRQVGTPVLESGQTANLLETYSGASAAYSLRKLRTTYYGFAIRVRRSSDNAEQDIAFKADGTLDTTSLLAFVGNGNGFVTTWYDQSGNSKDAIQTNAAYQPKIVYNGALIRTSGNIVALSCVNTNLVNQMTNTITHTQFIGWELSNTGSDYAFILPFGTVAAAIYNGALQSGAATSPYQNFGNPNYFVNGTSVAPNRNTLYTNTATSNETLVNSTGVVASGSGDVIGTNGRQLQYDFGFMGNYKLFEVIIYNSNQEANRTSINNNINSYYSIY
jgi:hypothetical protein